MATSQTTVCDIRKDGFDRFFFLRKHYIHVSAINEATLYFYTAKATF